MPFGLTGTLFAILLASGVLSVIAGVAYFAGWNLWTDYRDGGSTTLDAASNFVTAGDAASNIASIGQTPIFVLLVIWTNFAYKAVLSRKPTLIAWSSGWAIGGWFIPFANLVIPKLVINEIDRISHESLIEPVGDQWKSQNRTGVSDAWWILFVIGIIPGASATVIASEWPEYLWFGAIGLVVLGAGSIFGAITILRFGRRLLEPQHESAVTSAP